MLGQHCCYYYYATKVVNVVILIPCPHTNYTVHIQVGSALACVPAFSLMQGGVSHLGRGADNLVASLHSLSIGVGEVVSSSCAAVPFVTSL
jgi:hypothetical protein